MSLVEEEQLNLSMHLIASVANRRRNLNPVWLHLYIVKEAARPIPRGTDELEWDRVVPADFPNRVREVVL